MIDDFNTAEKADALFHASSDSKPNAYALVYSTFPTGMMILGGAGAAMSADVDQKFGGYLVRVLDDRLELCPMSKLRQANGISAPSKMKLANSRFFTLEKKHMESFKNRPSNGIIPQIRTITIKMDNGKKYVWQVNRSEKALPYHADGYQALAKFGETVNK